MNWIDSHTHLYLEQFDDDRKAVVERALQTGVNKMLLPAIDRSTFEAMMQLADQWPSYCYPMIGLHPTSVKEDVEDELRWVEEQLATGRFCAIGEIGIDLYWDKTFAHEQTRALHRQLQWAKQTSLPVAIHMRDSFDEVYNVVKEEQNGQLTGVFHCFTGTLEQAEKIIDLGFYLGIGGVLTFKNSGLSEVVQQLPLSSMILETDSPFLTPVPHRGKRNESAYIPLVGHKLAEVLQIAPEEVSRMTCQHTQTLFKLP